MYVNRYHLTTPTEVITTELNIPKNYQEECIQEAYKIGDKQKHQTNVKAIMSSYTVWDETDVYNPLLDKIISTIDKFLPAEHLHTGLKYILSNAWFAIYKEGHYTVPHYHLPSNISFVYYLKANKTSSPLIFDECNFSITPYDDLLVVFPSNLIHSVKPQVGKDNRICIAGNLKLEPLEQFNK